MEGKSYKVAILGNTLESYFAGLVLSQANVDIEILDFMNELQNEDQHRDECVFLRKDVVD